MYLSSSCDSKKSDSNGSSGTNSSVGRHARQVFFPPPPRLCKSMSNTSCSASCHSDSSASDGKILTTKKRNRRRYTKLPPIGVFWDIENCQVPKMKSAANIVKRIREFFFDGYREADFIVVCDVKKENPQIIQDLHDAQVNLIHVSSTSKNAADEKLRQSLRRFAETHPPPATVVLITGDVNFAADLSDLRYRKKLHVILVHNTNVSDALILCANESYTYASITDNLPELKNKVTEYVDLEVYNLPMNFDKKPLRHRLKFLSDNCGGKVIEVNLENGTAKIRFSSLDFAIRAQRRLNGEDVFGRKITVSNPCDWRSHNSSRNTGRKITKINDSHQLSYTTPTVPINYNNSYDNGMFNQSNQNNWRTNNEKRPALKLQEPNMFRSSRSCPPPSENMWMPTKSFSKPRTPQDEKMLHLHKSMASPDFADHSKNHLSNNTFQPITKQNVQTNQVELIITNLDSSVKDLDNVLLSWLKEHAFIHSLNITGQSDGVSIAVVRVGSQQDAQNIISQMHHHKFGFKRLSISYSQSNNLNPSQLEEIVIALLKEAPLNRMPLYKLMHQIRERFLTNVSVSDVNKLRDICHITDENGERIIYLSHELRSSPIGTSQGAQMLYCSVHCPNGLNSIEGMEWGMSETDNLEIPHVKMSLKELSEKLNNLLSSHMGTLPLLSFSVCYKHEFNEELILDSSGVPLEHLITCIPNIKLKYGGSNRNTKYIVREVSFKPTEADEEETFMRNLSPSITSNMNLLSRELVDLLKTTEKCQLQLSKYIPAYHHHFGRQLRVADYGYTKLSELLHNPPISNIVQILGEGSKRVITLTHSAQIRRFTSDLLRVLKNTMSKQLIAEDFPAAFERVLNKPFNAIEYGLCFLEDLLDEVPDNTVVITKSEDCITIAIPKRDQTPEEIIRTKQFAEEVVKLLSYSPECSILFNQFVPAYHHHFSRQCRVSNYGCTKLIELFENIPDTVKIEELSNGERKISLTLTKALNLRGNQIVDLIKKSQLNYLPLESLASHFLREYGFPLKPQFYGCSDINGLIMELKNFVEITYSSAGPLLVAVENNSHSMIALRVWSILVNPPHHLDLTTLINAYKTRYQSNITAASLEQLDKVVTCCTSKKESVVFLTPLYEIAAKLYLLLSKEGGEIKYHSLDNLYRKYYGTSLIQSHGEAYEKLLSDFSFLVIIRRTKKKTTISLNPKLANYGLQLPITNQNETFTASSENIVNWPPPPIHNPIMDGFVRITPPKPDTPPSPGTSRWQNWDTPTKFNSNMDFSIPMPAIRTPMLMEDPQFLISPVKTLLPACEPQLCVSSPHPHELPMPNKLLRKGAISDDSADSGVNNSNPTSENEMDISDEHNLKPDIKLPFIFEH